MAESWGNILSTKRKKKKNKVFNKIVAENTIKKDCSWLFILVEVKRGYN